MSEGAGDRQALLEQFAALTGLQATQAEHYLNAANGNLDLAVSLFYDEHADSQHVDSGDDNEMAGDDTSNAPQQQAPGGGRTLDGTYVPPASIPSSSRQPAASSRQPAQRGLRTIQDLQASGGGPSQGHGHSHNDGDRDSDEDYQDDEGQDFFAGGEKSGLAVQNPNAPSNHHDQINNILRRAKRNPPRPGGDDEQPSSHFRGAGTTLGGDDAPSRTIPDPNANVAAPPPRTQRELHLWRDGFSVDDGALYRYDDPANARTLEMINTGHAPLHILNVEHGQEVDVEVHAHKDEDYKQPKKKYVPFSGSGQRLGSPTPSFGTASSSTAATSSTPITSATTGSAAPTVDVDSSQPTITLQIRLGDGTRLQSRFNTTHTVGDVYDFVTSSSPTSQQRTFALMTTFPSKELDDKAQVLGDMAEFKRGGVVVQKWK